MHGDNNNIIIIMNCPTSMIMIFLLCMHKIKAKFKQCHACMVLNNYNFIHVHTTLAIATQVLPCYSIIALIMYRSILDQDYYSYRLQSQLHTSQCGLHNYTIYQ